MNTRLHFLSLILATSLTATLAHAQSITANERVIPMSNYSARPDVQAFIALMVERHGMDSKSLQAWFTTVSTQTSALRAFDTQRDPQRKSWKEYRARFLDRERIQKGLRFWQDNVESLEAARASFGVPEEIIVSIVGIETLYGKYPGSYQTLPTLTTLAFDSTHRAALFQSELEALLLLAREQAREPLSYQGSYAGALGLPQFLPSSVRRWGVDFDRDGKIDLQASSADTIGSVASFLSNHGWRENTPISQPADVDPLGRFNELIKEGIKPKRPPSELVEYGVRVVKSDDAPQAPEAACALIDLETPDGPTEYRLGFHNFYVITRYNRSSFYASAVQDLAQALRDARSEAMEKLSKK